MDIESSWMYGDLNCSHINAEIKKPQINMKEGEDMNQKEE